MQFNLKKIKCLSCRKVFEFIDNKNNKNRKFCSVKCYRKFRSNGNYIDGSKKGININCRVCKKIFYISKKDNQKFCSTECYRAFQKSGKYKIPLAKTGKNIKCKSCNKKVYVPLNRISLFKFCSRDCYLSDHSKNTVTKICGTCNKEFKSSKIGGGIDNKFCSRKCYLVYHKKIWKRATCPGCSKLFKIPANQKWPRKTCGVKCARKITKESTDRKEKISRSLCVQYIDGRRDVAPNGNDGYFYSKKNKRKIYYRSSYELTAYEILEQLSKVKSYNNEPFKIPYRWSGSIHNTIPDILVTYTDNMKELIEVKPRYMLKDKQTIFKLRAMKRFAKKNSMDFNIWTEKELYLN